MENHSSSLSTGSEFTDANFVFFLYYFYFFIERSTTRIVGSVGEYS